MEAMEHWNLRAMREHRNIKHKVKKMKISIGDVVLIKIEDRNRRKWKIGLVDKLYYGRDDVIRAVQVRLEKSSMQKPIQHLFPLELNFDIKQEKEKWLNMEVPLFRPKRTAAAIVKIGLKYLMPSNQIGGECREARTKLHIDFSRSVILNRWKQTKP